MHAVNIRQLEANPANALCDAKNDDLVVVMNRDHPEAVLVSLDKLELPDLDAVRVALAAALLRNGTVSAGFAARMAGKPLPAMLALLSSLEIPVAGASASEAHNDMSTARQWLEQPSSPTPDR